MGNQEVRPGLSAVRPSMIGGVLTPLDGGAGLSEHYFVGHLGGALRLAQQLFGFRFHCEIGFIWKFLMRVTVEDLELGLCRFEPLLDRLVALQDHGEAPLRVGVGVEFLHLVQALAESAEQDAADELLLVDGRAEVHRRFTGRV